MKIRATEDSPLAKQGEVFEVKEKRCSHCKKIFPIKMFCKNKSTNDGFYYICRVCCSNKLRKLTKKSPWLRHYYNARNRPKRYSNYSRIKFLMSREDFKFIWVRDNASLMKRPSVDRIDNNGNYELSNCKFIELAENNRRRVFNNIVKCPKVGQFTKDGDLINIFDNPKYASRETKICDTGIYLNLKNKQSHAGGYVWKFIYEHPHLLGENK